MGNIDLKSMSVRELLRHHSEVIEELRYRKVVRTKNNPVGDYAEWLVCKTFGWKLAGKSQQGYDAIDQENKTYQVKARRRTPDNKSVQLGTIRDLKNKPFDFLIGIIFEPDYTVCYAAQIPFLEVENLASYKQHVNGHVLHLRESVLQHQNVINITNQLGD